MFGPIRKEPRLSQWDGRRRSSRSDAPVLPELWRRPVLTRLGVVLATALAATLLAYLWGPPLPYRVGERYATDLRVRTYFEVVNQPRTDYARDAAVENLPPGAAENEAVREAARAAVPPVIDRYPVGVPLVQRGQPITEAQLQLLEEENRAYRQSLRRKDHVRRLIALFLTMGLLAAVAVLYVNRFQHALAESLPKIVSICALVLLTILPGMLLSLPPWHAALLPLTLTAMILTIAYNPQFALLMSVSLALAMTVTLGTGVEQFLVMLGGTCPAVLLLRNVRTRTKLVEVGLTAGLAYLMMTVATGLLANQTGKVIAYDGVRNFIWGSLAGFLLTGILPAVERVFGIVTDISLLELADGSHPLMQELVRRAPGTYTHSVTVATLAEAAAESIEANPLLCRVGCYFHDIGKMLKPQYFIENQTGENRHDALEPALSTLVIIGHVKDGVALAKQYRLPKPIIDIIQEHHGTTLVEYFYREAMRLQEDAGQGTIELESTFRYPGPKPRSRENGICMLADVVESSSRALRDPAPGSLRKLVHDLLMKRLLDGQFEESGLTLTELHLVEESLCKSLIALYHSRIKYPEAPGQQRHAS
jgi:cyclic-di-AMP phosphodiesterase PgpH